MSTTQIRSRLLASLLSDEVFYPTEPHTLAAASLPEPLTESLVCKLLLTVGQESGRGIARRLCVAHGVVEPVLEGLRVRQMIAHRGAAPLNDYCYALTDQGRERAQAAMAACAYVGPAPVTLEQYINSVEAQTIRAEAARREDLQRALEGVSADDALIDQLGPAVNSGAGMFLYGAPGNGKSTLARRITACFGQTVWIPHAVLEDGQIIKLYDAACHHAVEQDGANSLASDDHDRRWLRIRRPTVVIGGELTMDNLELRHDPISNVCEAPLQWKSNCGCLLIDDFGRQRIEPAELLNRWIIPLENGHDFLTLPTGKKIQVPFEQLIIFSTNLDPNDLADEAFLRRIPYKIEIGDPSEEEFHALFELYAEKFGCEYRRAAVEHLLAKHYRPVNRPRRRCQPRDLLSQISNLCRYSGEPVDLTPGHLDRVVTVYFTDLVGTSPGAQG